jgi:hypothetical protein
VRLASCTLQKREQKWDVEELATVIVELDNNMRAARPKEQLRWLARKEEAPPPPAESVRWMTRSESALHMR